MHQKSTAHHRKDIQQISPEDSECTGNLVENRLGRRVKWGYVEHIGVGIWSCGDVDDAGDQAAEKKERKNFSKIPPFMI